MTAAIDELVMVGLGELRWAKAPTAVLMALGLGSCVAVALHDPVTGIGGMAHVVLPGAGATSQASPAKFAEAAVPALIERVVAHGADRGRLVCKLAGGAQVLTTGALRDSFRIGERNTEAVLASLRKAGIRPTAMDCGGSTGRSFRLSPRDGRVAVKRVGQDWQEI